MPYKTFGAGNVLTAADMNAITADPVQADVATDQTTTSASYVDLATTGPSVTITMVNGQKATVTISAFCSNANDGAVSFMSFAVSGATTLSANDTNAAKYFAIKTGVNTGQMCERTTIFTATATGSHTFTCKYKSDGTNTQHWDTRRIIVKAG